jgi:hypothetical protein
MTSEITTVRPEGEGSDGILPVVLSVEFNQRMTSMCSHQS